MELLRAGEGGVVLLPEGGGPFPEHAAPVFQHLFRHGLQAAAGAVAFQLVEFEIGGGDGGHGVVFQDVFPDEGRLAGVGDAEADGKEVGVPGDAAVSGGEAVDERALVLVPIKAEDFCPEVRGAVPEGGGVIAQAGPDVGENLQGGGKENLLGADGAVLVQLVGPVHENPVPGALAGQAVFVGAADAELHEAFHLGVNLPDKGQVAGVADVIREAQDPVEGVVHDGVDLAVYGAVAAEGDGGALADVGIEEQVVV